MMNFLTGLAGLVPFIKILMDMFAPSNNTVSLRAFRILGLFLSILTIFSIFISVSYFEMYRSHIDAVSRLEHMTVSRDEYRDRLYDVEKDLRDQRGELMECLAKRLPYEDLQRLRFPSTQPPKDIVTPVAPEPTPVPRPKQNEAIPVIRNDDFRDEILNSMKGRGR